MKSSSFPTLSDAIAESISIQNVSILKRAHDVKAFFKLFAVTFQLEADEEVLAMS